MGTKNTRLHEPSEIEMNIMCKVADRMVNTDLYDFTFNGFILPSTGQMYLRTDSINPNDEIFLHELLHIMVYMME